MLRRQATTDSRWLEMVTPARVESGWSGARQAATAANTLAQISAASCSVQPGCGDARPTGAAPYPTTFPDWSTPMAFVLVVPWSIDRIIVALLDSGISISTQDLTHLPQVIDYATSNGYATHPSGKDGRLWSDQHSAG